MALTVPMRLQHAAMFALGRLPRGLARRLAGPPVTIDGHTLDPLAQLALKAINADPDSFDYHPVEQGRAQLAVESAVFGSRPPVDAVESFRWLRDHLEDSGVAPGAVAVAGESAGGNLTCVIAQETRADEAGGPAVQVPIFPATDHSRDWPSMDTFATGYFLTKRQMGWYRGHYFRAEADRLDPRASPLLAVDLTGVAAACVVLAGFDPLRDEGMAYAERLRAAGVPTDVLLFEGFIHGFINATNRGPR